MPIIPCQKDGKSGHKYGEHGYCYTGPNSKLQAEAQGKAIKASQASKGKTILSYDK